MKVILTTLIIFISLSVISCTTARNGYYYLSQFQKGTTRDKVSERLNENPDYQFDFGADESLKKTHVDLYEMVVSSRPSPIVQGVILLNWLTIKTKYDFFVFAYQNDQLVFSGTLDDFKRSHNPDICKIGNKINDELL
jgi:hypothetical protein